jgi:hypothetical protein
MELTAKSKRNALRRIARHEFKASERYAKLARFFNDAAPDDPGPCSFTCGAKAELESKSRLACGKRLMKGYYKALDASINHP